ncbi:MAG: CHASE2 domain-containing protein [Acidobacteriota bacterium]
MTAEEPQPAATPPKKPATDWPAKIRDKLLEASLVGFPLLLVNGGVQWLNRETTSQPWQVLVYLVPLAIGAGIVWRIARGRDDLRLRGPFLLFFGVYVTLFSLAAGAGFLDFERRMKGYAEATPPSVLGWNRLGDWRYALAPRVEATAVQPLAVVRSELSGERARDRADLARLLLQLRGLSPRAVALDLWFHGDDSTDSDPLLCAAIDGLRAGGVPVVVGYGLDSFRGDPAAIPPPPSLARCMENEHRGHLVGFAEADDVVRSVPLFFSGDPQQPALALAVVRALKLEDVDRPVDGLLRFLPPRPSLSGEDIVVVDVDELASSSAARRSVANKVVLVGVRSAAERFATPFGERLGVEIHAMTVHSLATGSWLRRLPWWASFAAVFVCCWILVSGAADPEKPARRLVLRAAGLSLALLALAALGAALFRLWLDVSYGLVALWLLLGLLLPLRKRLQRQQPRPDAG